MDENRGLWRGKRLNDGEWVKGLLEYRDLERTSVRLYSENDCYGLWVNPSTLGECTGLTDKNGKLIFEGDILGFDGVFGSYDLVEYHNGVFGVRTKPEDGGENYSCCEFPLYEELNDCVPAEIIGNIHDNPELLMNATGEDIGNATQDTLAPAT